MSCVSASSAPPASTEDHERRGAKPEDASTKRGLDWRIGDSRGSGIIRAYDQGFVTEEMPLSGDAACGVGFYGVAGDKGASTHRTVSKGVTTFASGAQHGVNQTGGSGGWNGRENTVCRSAAVGEVKKSSSVSGTV